MAYSHKININNNNTEFTNTSPPFPPPAQEKKKKRKKREKKLKERTGEGEGGGGIANAKPKHSKRVNQTQSSGATQGYASETQSNPDISPRSQHCTEARGRGREEWGKKEGREGVEEEGGKRKE